MPNEDDKRAARDLVFDFTKQVVTLALAGIGFEIGIYSQGKLSSIVLPLSSVVFFVLSIISGFILITTSINLLESGKFSTSDSKVKLRAGLQILFFVLGFSVLCDTLYFPNQNRDELRFDIDPSQISKMNTFIAKHNYRVELQGSNVFLTPATP